MGDEEGSHWFGHTGRQAGINGELRIYPESGYVIVVAGNFAPPSASRWQLL